MSVRKDKKLVIDALKDFPDEKTWYSYNTADAIGVKDWQGPDDRLIDAIFGPRGGKEAQTKRLRASARINAAYKAAKPAIDAHNKRARQLMLARLDAITYK